MGKRKQSVPQKAGEEKRKCMTWNMMDNAASNKDLIIDDTIENVGNISVSKHTSSSQEDKNTSLLSVGSSGYSSFAEEPEGPSYRNSDLLDIYGLHVQNCSFSIPVFSEPQIKPDSWKCVLGNFQLRFSPHPTFVSLPTDDFPDVRQFILHVSNEGDKNILSYEIIEMGKCTPSGKRKQKKSTISDVKFWLVDVDLPLKCLEALKCKSLQVVIRGYDCLDKCVTMGVVGTESILSKLSCPGEAIRSAKQQNQALKVLMHYFYGISEPDYTDQPFSKKHDIDNLYRVIKEQHMKTFGHVVSGVQHPDLLPKLRPYQQQAITWMLEKERNNDKRTEGLHTLYTKVVTLDGQTLYFHRYAGIFVLDYPHSVSPTPGGILGEEMGLGKTVEVLACMLHNPRENIPLPDPLPVIDDKIEDGKIDKKKKRKRKKKRKDSTSSESDAETIIYSDLDEDALSAELNDQSDCEDLNGTDQSDGCDMKIVDCDTNLQCTSGDSERNRKICDSVKSRKIKNIFTEKPEVHKAEFECLCGLTGIDIQKSRRKKKHLVQCIKCSLRQHAECVNYDLKDPFRGEFKCPHCHVASDPIKSRATLIISPFSIAHQWVEEILKHVKKEAISVFMYSGVHKQGFIQPWTLAKQDIVITTYETLRKEIDYVDLPHSNSSEGRKLRHAKRFMAIPSPIVAVQWWRICLDEAQMVECTTTKTAEMAHRLSAINRWCVTGTPIQKSVDDLYGLLLFLGVDPYWVYMWWNKLVFTPFCHGFPSAMHDILTSVLWRTVKCDILDQINIPEQSDEIHWLTFSPVEEHFYRQQYRDCVRLSMERLSKWTDSNIRLSSLDRHTVSQLMYPLLRLRQACCHPQAVRGEFLPIHKSTMTMEELLESLTKKAKLEAEESHRALVAAINGEAGLYIINEQFVEAVDKYRDVLRSVEEHKDTLKTDSLQQLHAMYNLNEVLKSKPEGVAPTLRDDLLSKQIDELRDRYMAKAVAFVKSTEEALAPAREEVKQLQRECKDSVKEWWFEVIQWAVDRDLDDKLVLKVRDDLSNNMDPKINTPVRSCRSVSGLEYAVHTQLSGMETSYQAVLKSLKGLEGVPSQDLINKTVECCLRPEAGILKNCPFCKCEDLLETFEAKLFSFVEKGMERHLDDLNYQVNTKRKGTWADSEAEKALRSILSFAKHYRVSEEVIENGTLHIKLLEAMKKEFKKLRAHWAGIKEHVGAFDELDMSTTRLRLRLPDEPVPKKLTTRRNHLLQAEPDQKTPELNVLEKSELSQHKLKLASDRIIAQAELRKKLGQLLYLTNLAKNQTNNVDGSNPEPCPICQQELGKEWSVMQCGHCYCIECVRILVERASFGRRNFSVKCAVCRQNTHQGEISYVMTSRELQPDDIGVKGSHSTKVEAVVRCLLQIQKENPMSKSLVFSTWTDVLSVIATALEENDIQYKALYSAGKFQENLTSFRLEENVTTLLLPVHSGANGLNLIEATNVLLVEPILNPAHELQAIGRVHRIGQTKSTHVHRFLIRNTIEQKMHILLQTMDKHNVLEKSEESGLTIGDLSSLFTQQMEEEDREGVHSLDEDERSSPRRDSETPNGSSLTKAEMPSTSRSAELETRTSSSTELETPNASRSTELATPRSELETPSACRSTELETPSACRSAELETPNASRSTELETPWTSSLTELETPSASRSTELETPSACRSAELGTPSTSRSTELETPTACRSAELEAPSTSWSAELETPGACWSTELETPNASRSTELETPSACRSAELETPNASRSTELETPSTSRSTELETSRTGSSTELEAPSACRSAELGTPSTSISTELETPSTSRSTELATPRSELETPSACRSTELETPSACRSAELWTPSTSISTELETPNASRSTELATPRSELETPSACRSTELETPSACRSAELETPNASRSTELETPWTSSLTELETPSASRSTELETPSACRSAELGTPSTSRSTELETPTACRSAELEAPSTSWSAELETPGACWSTELETPNASRSTELETPSACRSAELETPNASRSTELETPWTSSLTELETPSASRSTELETPSACRSAELETPRTSSLTELETPSASRSTELVTPSASRSTELETPSAVRSAELGTPSACRSAELGTPSTCRSVELETPNASRSTELETPWTSSLTELETPSASRSAELETPNACRSAELETPRTSSLTELETRSASRSTKLGTPSTSISTELETPSTSSSTELESPGASRSTELETPCTSSSTELSKPSSDSSSEIQIVRGFENCANASSLAALGLRFDTGCSQEARTGLLGSNSDSQTEHIQR